MKLTEDQITKINNECPSDQGIFFQPNGIPVDIKEHVVYMRWETGGWRGGGYRDGAIARPYTSDEPKPKFKALDLVLKELKPNISFLEFREIEELIRTNHESESEYYGNSTDYEIEFIVLSELITVLEKF